MNLSSEARERMIERHLVARGIHDPAVLAAMRSVPREEFLAAELAEFAYEDAPLPIEEGQTISQPYIVAAMIEALELAPDDRVLEVGTGSGYAAAVLSRVAREVYTIERHQELARVATRRLRDLGFDNVHVRHGDGTLGWTEQAPFDAIVVAAGGPEVPRPLLDQLAPGGRLVIPVGATQRDQELLRLRKGGDGSFEREELGPVRFVPLVGAEGWSESGGGIMPARQRGSSSEASIARLIAECAEPLASIDEVDLDPLLDRIGDARIVLLGEATHGTSEFYRMRARITRELIVRRGFTIMAVEADWPDAARIDQFIRHAPGPAHPWKAFARFPTWMWRNREVEELVHWLRDHNGKVADSQQRAGFYGLDLYSLYTSIGAVLGYLDKVDPAAAKIARERYGCLTPWQNDPAAYGRAALTSSYGDCEEAVVEMLRQMLDERSRYRHADGDRYLDALQNARLVANAEHYYRAMYYGSVQSWNLRDQHMFETLQLLLAFRGPESRAVVWEHNSHIGNAAATEMHARGEHNVGELVREKYGDAAYLVGFGTDRGTVAAASDWDGEMETKQVRPAHPRSYEHLCHRASVPAFLMALRQPRRNELRDELSEGRLERAIGVIYRPETELASHYFQAVLPDQFDEYIWFDRSQAVTALATAPTLMDLPETYPFGL
ncbi:MAG TPA: protein-L-isoaspartate(D-aspartate) O-methyltransferase [Terriglobales bacterium]|nr:protein-L-isoaspartate(D-aspartate) O-methyltransferase [Terriglobales bacterium]